MRAKAKRALNNVRAVAGKKWGGNRKNIKKNFTMPHVENILWLPIIHYSFCRKTKETGQHTQRRHKNIYRGFKNFTSRIPTCRRKLFPPGTEKERIGTTSPHT